MYEDVTHFDEFTLADATKRRLPATADGHVRPSRNAASSGCTDDRSFTAALLH